jgi:hypothetical protein
VYTVPAGLEAPPLVLLRGLPPATKLQPPTYLHAAMARFPVASGAQLVRWAGDLDGDGRLDLVLSLNTRFGTDAATTLFLSSAAQGGSALVGAAASFSYWPVGNPGC